MKTVIDRITAHKEGLNKYYTGKVCANGHLDYRWVKSGTCVSCARDSTRRYQKRFQ